MQICDLTTSRYGLRRHVAALQSAVMPAQSKNNRRRPLLLHWRFLRLPLARRLLLCCLSEGRRAKSEG